jgi:hypothetical protein
MVRNGHSVIIFPKWLLSNITYGTKWLWCKIHMVRKGFWLWYEIAILWYEIVNYGTKWQWYEMTSFEKYILAWKILKILLSHCATVEQILSPKNAISQMGFYPGASHIVNHCCTKWAKGDPLTQSAEGGYEVFGVGFENPHSINFPLETILHNVTRYSNRWTKSYIFRFAALRIEWVIVV